MLFPYLAEIPCEKAIGSGSKAFTAFPPGEKLSGRCFLEN
jgi:hypothetical protein